MKLEEKKRLIEKLQEEVLESEMPKMTKSDEKKLTKIKGSLSAYDGEITEIVTLKDMEVNVICVSGWDGEVTFRPQDFDMSNFTEFENHLWEHCQGCEEWKVFRDMDIDTSKIEQKHQTIVEKLYEEFASLQLKYPHLTEDDMWS